MLFFKTLLSHRKKQSNRSVWDPQLDALALLPHCWEGGKNCTKIKERGNKHKSHLVRLQGVGLQRVCFPEVHLRKAGLSLEPFPPVLSKSHRAPSYSGASPSQQSVHTSQQNSACHLPAHKEAFLPLDLWTWPWHFFKHKGVVHCTSSCLNCVYNVLRCIIY